MPKVKKNHYSSAEKTSGGIKVFCSCELEADSCFRSPSVPVWVLAVLVMVAFLWGLKGEESM